jgi:hypothetical protein
MEFVFASLFTSFYGFTGSVAQSASERTSESSGVVRTMVTKNTNIQLG